jgi:predicted amidohydrolase
MCCTAASLEKCTLESLPVILIAKVIPLVAPLFDFPVLLLSPQVVLILQRNHHSYRVAPEPIKIPLVRDRVDDVDANILNVKKILKTAGEEGVDLLVLPELANSGYMFKSRDEALARSETIPDGLFSTSFLEWSHEGRVVVVGICEMKEGNLYNSAAVFADGKHLTTYRKIHLFDRENEWFLPGNEEPPVVDFKGNKIGVMVCFDWAFPEVARILALKGADIILHPANLVLPYCQNAMITRSIENRVFTATANRVGTERGVVFSGMSQITGPKGELLLQLQEEKLRVAWVDLDLSVARDKKITKRNDVMEDRRPSIYRPCHSFAGYLARFLSILLRTASVGLMPATSASRRR